MEKYIAKIYRFKMAGKKLIFIPDSVTIIIKLTLLVVVSKFST